MPEKHDPYLENLRRQALKRLPADLKSTIQPETGDLTPAETAQLIQDLRVYQIELEIQNEELRHAQESLSVSHSRFSRLFHQAPVGYLVLNSLGSILEANETFCRMIGHDFTRLVNKYLADFLVETDRDIFMGRYKALFKQPGGKHLEVHLCCSEGRPLVVRMEGTLLSAPVVPDPQAVQSQLLLIVSDITEYKQIEKNRLVLEQKLHQAQKAESLGRMAGAIAHHFNNLLTSVMGNLELASDDPAICSNTRELLLNATHAAQRGADISTLMLAYLGKAAGTREEIDLVQLGRDSLLNLPVKLSEHVKLKTVFPEKPLMVEANGKQLKLAFSNLLNNAMEALGDDGGQITITLNEIPASDIYGADYQPPEWYPTAQHYACLTISDTGSGIAPEHRNKLFEPFFSTRFTGRGLGLPVALGIIKAHGGAITLESQPAEGTTIRFFLPLSIQAPKEFEAPVRAGEKPAQGLILVVDDEPAVRKLGKMMLEHFGYSVITAAHGVEGIQQFEKHSGQIACVLLDLTMPQMDGWQTLTALRQRQPDIPVILCSGYDQAQVMAEEHAEQPQVFLHKPYRMVELQAAVWEALEDRR